MEYLFSLNFYLYVVNLDVTKERKRKEKKLKYSKSECVCLYLFFYFLYIFFYDEIAKIKEEFNILIGSRSRIINLYASCISNIR